MSNVMVLGFALLLASMICLGSWPALLRLASSSSSADGFPAWLGSTRRDMRFAYLDYAISYSLSSSIPLGVALLVGKDDETATNAIASNSSSTLPLIGFALVGGGLLSFGNMSMQWATTAFGAPLTTVVALQASLTVLLGTSINFILQPEKTAHPTWLLCGVVTFLFAIALATRAQVLYGREGKELTTNVEPFSECGIEMDECKVPNPRSQSYNYLESEVPFESAAPFEWQQQQQATSSAGALLAMDDITTHSYPSHLALPVAMLGGLCFGFFSPAFNVAVNDPLDWTGGNALSVPVANLWFSLSFTVASLVGHIPLLYHPPSPFRLEPTTFAEYCDTPLIQRKLPIMAGFLCGMGNLLQFQGGNMVGFATADLVQAFPLISTVWDVALFREFQRARGAVVVSLVAMYMSYLSGIGLIMASVAN